MARPKWTPQTEEQRRALAALRRAVKSADTADARMWEAARAANEVGVPVTFIATETGRERTTVHRNMPPGKDSGGES